MRSGVPGPMAAWRAGPEQQSVQPASSPPARRLALEAGWGRSLLFLISGSLSLLWNALTVS